MKKRVVMFFFCLIAFSSLCAEEDIVLTLNQEQCCDFNEADYYEWPPRRKKLLPVYIRSYNYAEDEIMDRRGASHWPGKREGDLYEDLSR